MRCPPGCLHRILKAPVSSGSASRFTCSEYGLTAGGGIVSTVTATRAASEDALVTDALRRLDTLIAEGVTTIEVKSGYGLSVADEIKMLRAARRLAAERDVRVVTSYLAAHAVPSAVAAPSADERFGFRFGRERQAT